MIKALIFINIYMVIVGIFIIFLAKLLSHYGVCTIIINDDKEFSDTGGKSLLRMLFEHKYFIPSSCGGKGTCGYCKLRVPEGGGEVLPTETLLLTSKEVKHKFRLACQLKVRNNLKVLIPPEYLEIKEYEGQILSSSLVTSDIKKICIGLLPKDEFHAKPGQYVQVNFVTPEGNLDFRAYSVASHPDNKEMIELNVKLIPEGYGSSYLHSLKPGDKVHFSGPYGDFYLKTDSARKIVCVAGGVGLAPIKAIIAYWCSHVNSRVLELYYGSRTIKDLYDHKMFEELAQVRPNFHYYPALSEEDPNWKGGRGFIHKIIEKYLMGGADAEAYLCGPPIMIDAVTEVLKEKGVPEERIWYDKF
ncbi:MAG: NADH:ubiquinone reductase (Na(+)-transporting) subunit F [bacterium]